MAGISTTRTPRTLEALRTALAQRVGMAAGASFGSPMLDSFLQGAQTALYDLVDWKHLRTDNVQPLRAGTQWVDLPDDCNLERILVVQTRALSSSMWDGPMGYGIEPWRRSLATPGLPVRYETRWNAQAAGPWGVQIEVHPPASTDRELRVEYIRALGRFEQDADVCSIPDELVFLHALANAKAHFRQPDAPQYATQLDNMLTKIRAQHRRNPVVTPRQHSTVLAEDLVYLRPPE